MNQCHTFPAFPVCPLCDAKGPDPLLGDGEGLRLASSGSNARVLLSCAESGDHDESPAPELPSTALPNAAALSMSPRCHACRALRSHLGTEQHGSEGTDGRIEHSKGT